MGERDAAKRIGILHLFFARTRSKCGGLDDGLSVPSERRRNKEQKAILAVSGDRDPRRGFSDHETLDRSGWNRQHKTRTASTIAKRRSWRLLFWSEKAGKYRAGMWDRITGPTATATSRRPVEMDATGNSHPKIGDSR